MTETISRAWGPGGDRHTAQAAVEDIVEMKRHDGWKPAGPPLVMDMGKSGVVTQTIEKEG